MTPRERVLAALLLAPTHILEPEVPWENVEAFVAAAKSARYFRWKHQTNTATGWAEADRNQGETWITIPSSAWVFMRQAVSPTAPSIAAQTRANVGVGIRVAGAGICRVAHHAVARLLADRSASPRCAGAILVANDWLHLPLRGDVGRGQPDFWFKHALSGHVARTSGGVGLHRLARHARAATVHRTIRQPHRHRRRSRGVAGRAGVPGRNRHVRSGWRAP